MRRLFAPFCMLSLLVLSACASEDTTGTKCSSESTMEVVSSIFDARGCNNSTCHGAPAEQAAGGLDLRPDSFYDSVVNVSAKSGSLALVFPGDEEYSVLYLKLAAKTLETDLASVGVSGSPMPSIGDELTEEELEVVRAWIRGGAPRVGVVAEADGLLGCEGSESITPNKIAPLPPPAEDEGIQFYSGGWELGAQSEDEVCYVVYYDYSDRVPDYARLPCSEDFGDRECFAYKNILLAQDPQSHHSIVESYAPTAMNPQEWDPNDPSWKNWQCLGGAKSGTACDPTDEGFCGERSTCATAVCCGRRRAGRSARTPSG